MSHSIHAQPSLKFLPPQFKGWVLSGVYQLLPLYLRFACNTVKIEGENTEILVDCYRRFQAGELRFLMAYRHSSPTDPPSLIQYLHTAVPKMATEMGLRLNQPVFAYFIYDRGIPIWAGPLANWLLPAIGGIPVIRGRPDFASLRTFRHLYAFGQFPMAVAPEGYTNAHSELVSPLELGCAQTSFWCVEDMVETGQNQPVCLVPIGVRYLYLKNPWAKLMELLRDMERECGFSPSDGAILQLETKLLQQEANSWQPAQELTPEEEALLYPRLLRLAEYLLAQMEGFYRRFHHRIQLPGEQASSTATSPAGELAERLQALMDAVLKMLEGYFKIEPRTEQNLIERSHAIEDTVWDWIYRRDVDIRTLSGIERGLANRIAEEAHAHLWHMKWVESFVTVTGHYLQKKPTSRRFAETLLMLNTLIHDITGRGKDRPPIAPQKAIITVGEPISVTERWEASYKHDHHREKQAVRELTQAIKESLESMIPT